MDEVAAVKRRYPRYHVEIPVIIYVVTGEIRSRIAQISRGGCLIFPTLPTLATPSLKLSFRLTQDLPSINCKGESVYTVKDKGTGIVFTEISQYNQDLITEYFAAQPETK